MSDDLVKRIQEKCAGRDRWYVMNAAEDGYCMDFDWGYDADRWMDDRLRENPDYIKRNGYHLVKKRSFTSAEELANEASALIEHQATRIAALEYALTVPADALPPDGQEWANISPEVAFHLIERHAENWAHAGQLMEAWRIAVNANAAAVAPAVDAQAVAWLVTGGKTFVDRAFVTEAHADKSIAERKDGARKVPLGRIDAALSQHTGEKDD